jgi:hypothetical protein
VHGGHAKDPKPGSGAVKAALLRIAARTRQAPGNRLYMPDGKVHGVCTWTLLEGLRGGASDERAGQPGRVGGRPPSSWAAICSTNQRRRALTWSGGSEVRSRPSRHSWSACSRRAR